MQTKFLYITDIHNKSERDQPKMRTDSYYRSVLTKQEEIGQIIIDRKPDVLLFGGDLFDHFDAPMSLVNDVAAIWKTYNVKSIIGVVGSHDYNGFQVKTLRRTGLGNFITHGLMQIVSNGNDMFPRNLTFLDTLGLSKGIAITGTPHSYALANDPKNFATSNEKGDFVIQLVHGDLYHVKVPWQHQLITDIHPYITADLVLSGHIHSGWENPIIHPNPNSVTGQTMYVNPGSIGRTENGKARPIRVFEFEVVNIDQGSRLLTTNYINLQNVIENPFREKSESIEGSPITDFSNLMNMISTMNIKPSDYKQHVPKIVEELYGKDHQYYNQVVDRMFDILEKE